MSSCLDQWNRVGRWLARIEAMPPTDSTTYDDFVWAFFQNCWHLKDWIKNDQSLPAAVRNSVEAEAASSPALMICADLANGSKHLDLQKPRAGAGAKHSHRVLTVVGGAPSQSRIEYFIALDDGSRVAALDVARQALAEWKRILLKLGVAI